MMMDKNILRHRFNISDDPWNDCWNLESSNYLMQSLRKQVILLLFCIDAQHILHPIIFADPLMDLGHRA